MQAGVTALRLLSDPAFNSNMLGSGELRDMWCDESVTRLSWHPRVERVVVMGTVLAVELKVPEGGTVGYGATLARSVTVEMRTRGAYARPLGNTVYVMCTPTSSAVTVQSLLAILEAGLNAGHVTGRGAASIGSIV